MNPWGGTPTRRFEDGTDLAETAAILRSLDQPFPGRKIMGETAIEQGQNWMWENRIRRRWQEQDSFRQAYSDGGSGIAQIDGRAKAS